MNWVPYGPQALLVRFADRVGEEAFERGRALARHLEENPPPGLVEFVPAFTSVLLEFDAQTVPDVSRAAPNLVQELSAIVETRLPPAPVKSIPVMYDGPDLGRVAELSGLSREEVCALHAANLYRVYMLGFAPGFPYLGDLDPRLHTPRLETPRPRVPAGSVAIGGEHTGIYSVDSPGGWNIIGHTTEKIFVPAPGASDPAAMFRLRAGDRVQFIREV